MSRYVCDYKQVTNSGIKMCDAATKMRSAANKYSSGIDTNLAKWTGEAKDAFTSSNAKQIELMNAQAEYLEVLGEFMKKASNEIEKLDIELSSLEI